MDITPLSFCEFFEIHGSKFKPYPIRDLGEAAVGGITHSVFFFSRAYQEFCVNEIKTFEKSIENNVDLCCFACLCIPPGSPQEIQLAPDDPPVGIGHHPLRGNVQRP